MRKAIRIISFALAFITLIVMILIFALSSHIPENFNVVEGQTLTLNDNFIQPSYQTVDNNVDDVSITAKRGDNYTVDLKLLGLLPVKQVEVDVVEPIMVVPGGTPFGVKMFTDGVLVIGMDDIDTSEGNANPAKTAGLRIGDVIETIDGKKVSTNEDVAKIISACDGKELVFDIRRKNLSFDIKITPAKSVSENRYKLGAWVRDSSAGIGTMTFYLPDSNIFAGLGHGICDSDTGDILPLMSGEIVPVEINSIVKGAEGEPGELRGSFKQSSEIGKLLMNTETGIFGQMETSIDTSKAIPMAMKQEVTEGPAQIICTVNDQTCYYDVEIEKVYLNNSAPTRNMVVKITDPELLNLTGGIVQGMSGSPIIQNGKLIGAVTHVFINDPTRGYGIFAENMINTIETENSNSLPLVS